MAALRQEQHYGLCCGDRTRTGFNRTLFHVKLTDTAIRALEAHQNVQGTSPTQPSICFKGHQGYIKIPAPTAEAPAALRVFSFYLSSDSKDQPQASFDCIHQYVSSDGREQLEGQGIIQDKITVCATDDSYQMTRERMSQVEKDSWSRAAIEIKPGASHPSKYVQKFQKRPAAVSASDSSFSKTPCSGRRNGGIATVTPKTLRERIIHLLALKSYKKPELLLWLERERVSPKERNELGSILEEVAKVNPKDNSYLLRDDFYRHVRRDWPGYNEEDKQLISRLLLRKMQPNVSNQPRNPQANASILKNPEDPTLHPSSAKTPAVKRPVPLDSMERLAVKRQRLSEQQQQTELLNKELKNPSVHTKTEFQRTSSHTGNYSSSPGATSTFSLTHKLSSTDTPLSDTREPQPKVSSHQPPPPQQDVSTCSLQPLTNSLQPLTNSLQPLTNSLQPLTNSFQPLTNSLQPLTNSLQPLTNSLQPLTNSLQPLTNSLQPLTNSLQPLTNSQHRKKKSKKHKDKERERLKDEQSRDWFQTSPDLKKNVDKLDNPVASEGKPDYVLTYDTIRSLEQRQRYQDDFCAEYDEYKDLHSRIATITHMFVQLGSKIKSLSPGSQEYKIMEDQILEKYNKYRKKFPGYREEKKHCEYLHQKLSYIKQLIIDYDVSQASS